MQLKPEDERVTKRVIRAWVAERKLPDPGPNVTIDQMLDALLKRDPNEAEKP